LRARSADLFGILNGIDYSVWDPASDPHLAARYSIGYLSSDTRKDGAWRKVDIRLKRAELKGAKLRARSGYFAPYKDGGL